jgi:DNA-directed RNA polymerase subunit RPC12/RpoP
MQPRRPARAQPAGDFEEFQASEIFCPRCRVAQPVRERLLLVLPDGDLFEYLCARCNSSVGSRKVSGPAPSVFVP